MRPTPVIIAADLALPTAHLDDHTNYVGSWLRVLKRDNRAVMTAEAKAAVAAGFLLRATGLADMKQPTSRSVKRPDHVRAPDLRATASATVAGSRPLQASSARRTFTTASCSSKGGSGGWGQVPVDGKPAGAAAGSCRAGLEYCKINILYGVRVGLTNSAAEWKAIGKRRGCEGQALILCDNPGRRLTVACYARLGVGLCATGDARKGGNHASGRTRW